MVTRRGRPGLRIAATVGPPCASVVLHLLLHPTNGWQWGPRDSTLEPRSKGADGVPGPWRHASGTQAAQRLRRSTGKSTLTRQPSRCQLLQEAGAGMPTAITAFAAGGRV